MRIVCIIILIFFLGLCAKDNENYRESNILNKQLIELQEKQIRQLKVDVQEERTRCLSEQIDLINAFRPL